MTNEIPPGVEPIKDPPRIIHPYFFAVFPAISLVADHLGFVSVNWTIVGLAVLTLAVAILTLQLLRRRGIEGQKAAIFVTGGLLFFFSYGHFFDLLTESAGLESLRHRHLLVILLLAVVPLVFLLRRTSRDLSPLTKLLNVVGGTLIVLSAVQIVSYNYTSRVVWEPGGEFVRTDPAALNPETLPDIYYIILDSYASASSLADYYDFDNNEFVGALDERGFYVAGESASNYAMTTLSLSSSLNLDYLARLRPEFTQDELNLELPRQMIENNTVMSFLRSLGYRLHFFGSGQGITEQNRYVDDDNKCSLLDETRGRILHSTLIWPFAEEFNLLDHLERRKRLCVFEQIGQISSGAGPHFVFAHIPAPHPPFLFDALGNPVHEPASLGKKGAKRYYLNQLLFINTKVLEMIDTIIAGSRVDPVIIIQADHGPQLEFGLESGDPDPPEGAFRERMRILNAYYLSEAGRGDLYEAISPVNTFRLIFNNYFQTALPLLDDRSYYSPLSDPLRITEVTEIVAHE
jgi:hypothetical protein